MPFQWLKNKLQTSKICDIHFKNSQNRFWEMKNDFFRLTLTICFIAFMHTVVRAGEPEGYEIKVKLSEFTQDTIFLGYQMGDKTFIRDTAFLDKKTGFFTFKKPKKLEAGVYLIVTPPDNQYFQIMISPDEQHFSLATSTKDPYSAAKLKGSKDNDLFFDYMHFLSDKRKEAEAAGKLRPTKDSLESMKKLDALDKEVKSYQLNLVKKNPETVSATLIKSAIEIEMPPFNDVVDKDQKELARYYFYKQHFFDNYDLSNPALLRTPVLQQRLDMYLDRLTPQHPDSISESLDRIFMLMKSSKETFQYYFITYLNKYAKSQIVGFDAIYVHLAKTYIEKGFADGFIEKENREKILQNANKLEPILIGKKAPEIKVFKEDNSMISVSEVKSKYTILFFFAPDCGHCQKQSPFLVEFFKKAKEKNQDVKVLAVCTYLGPDKMPECWKYVKEKGFDEFINTVDPYLISRYKTLYNVETTPQIYVLDENKIIRSKGIEAKQLTEVMDFIIKEDAEKLKENIKKQ